MKRGITCLTLCVMFILLFAGCQRNSPDPLSQQETAIKEIADAAVLEKYQFDDLEDFSVHVYNSRDGIAHFDYVLQICGFKAHDTIRVDIAADGTVVNIEDTLGEYSIFLNRVTKSDLFWAKLRMELKRLPYLGERYDYHLSTDQDGNLCLCIEIIDQFRKPKADENGEVKGGCGYDHEHLYFHEILCPAP